MSELKYIKATALPASQVMAFRQAFLSAGEDSIPGSRGLHNYDYTKTGSGLSKSAKSRITPCLVCRQARLLR